MCQTQTRPVVRQFEIGLKLDPYLDPPQTNSLQELSPEATFLRPKVGKRVEAGITMQPNEATSSQLIVTRCLPTKTYDLVFTKCTVILKMT